MKLIIKNTSVWLQNEAAKDKSMKQELDQIKHDVETIQKAMGLVPSRGREWIQWMQRDNWLNLWCCLPGVMLIASALLPSGKTERYFGLALAQWAGLLVAAVTRPEGAVSFFNYSQRQSQRQSPTTRPVQRQHPAFRYRRWPFQPAGGSPPSVLVC